MLDRSKLIPDTDGFYCKHRLPCSISTLWQHATSLHFSVTVKPNTLHHKTQMDLNQQVNTSLLSLSYILACALHKQTPIHAGVHASLNILHSPPSPITKCAVYFPFPPLLHPPILPLLLLFFPSVKRRMNWTLFSHI